MKLVIISGLSGAGKTVALRSLEDKGAYCIDNLPATLLSAVIDEIRALATDYDYIALGLDARNLAGSGVNDLTARLQQTGLAYDIVFLTANEASLIQRYRETRRKHPMAQAHQQLSESIQHERNLLQDLLSQANIVIDSSELSVYQLRDLMYLQIGLEKPVTLPLLLQSFGFKYGVPQDVDFVFDVRCFPNPYWQIALRPLTGLDPEVVTYLQEQTEVQQLIKQLKTFLTQWIAHFDSEQRSYLSIAIGCTGGCHRSVFVVQQLAKFFETHQQRVLIRHRELS